MTSMPLTLGDGGAVRQRLFRTQRPCPRWDADAMTARVPDAAPRAVVVVEGESDAAAVRAAAWVLGRDLAAEAVEVVSLGGVTGVRRYLSGTSRAGVRVPGLCDERESADFARALGVLGDQAVFVCRAD